MNNNQHPPARWSVVRNGDRTWVDDGADVVCILPRWGVTETDREKRQQIIDANARLIAAAPEMLEALQACAEVFDWLAAYSDRHNIGREEYAHAAIAVDEVLAKARKENNNE